MKLITLVLGMVVVAVAGVGGRITVEGKTLP
jgi:hypothetical protein